MGVVYKLNDILKDFIISHKKENPALSCRGLVNLVDSKFKISLSKSSINAIIKEAGLSSPVGRHPKIKRAKPSLPPVEKPRAEKPEIHPVEKPKIEPPPEIKEEKLEIIEIKEKDIIDNAGFIFLKAAQWCLCRGNILAEMVKPYISDYPLDELEENSQALLYLSAFGFKDFEAAGSAADSLEVFFNRLKSLKELPLLLWAQGSLTFSEASYIKIILADNTVIFLDGQFKTLWQEQDIPQSFSSAPFKALNYIRQSLQENGLPLQILTIPGYTAFSRAFYEFIYACENFPQKRMQRISLHNQYKEEIIPPIKLAPMKRYFVMAFWPWQNESGNLVQADIRATKHFFSEELSKEIFFSEIKSYFAPYQSMRAIEFRAALLRDDALQPPKAGLLTNLPEEKNMEGIVSTYLGRWPNLDEGYQDFLKKCEKANQPASAPSSSPKAMDLWQYLRFLVSQLHNLSQKRFFPAGYAQMDFSVFKERFYSLPGQIEERPDKLVVRLVPAPDYPFLPELLYALRRVNESDVYAKPGQRLWLEINSSQ